MHVSMYIHTAISEEKRSSTKSYYVCTINSCMPYPHAQTQSPTHNNPHKDTTWELPQSATRPSQPTHRKPTSAHPPLPSLVTFQHQVQVQKEKKIKKKKKQHRPTLPPCVTPTSASRSRAPPPPPDGTYISGASAVLAGVGKRAKEGGRG